MKTTLYTSLLLASISIFSGCGSEVEDLSGNPLPILGKPNTGLFISRVEGLGYTRMLAPTPQLTGRASNYDYRTGELINFHVGALEIGEVIGLSVLSPKEIVAYKNLDLDTSIYAPEVNNRIRLLMSLDSDSNPANGILIPEDIQRKALSWETPDYAFGEDAFSDSVYRVTNGDLTITASKEDAEIHFAESLRCVYSGAYTGYRVDDNGTHNGFVGVMIQSTNTEDNTSSFGTIVALSDGQDLNQDGVFDEYLFARGVHNMDKGTYIFDETGEFKDAGIVQSDANVTGDGVSNGYNKVLGTFRQFNPVTNTVQAGAYEATRAFEGKNVAYRYTGYGFGLDDDDNASNNPILGLFAFDINTDGTVIGMIHDAATGEEPDLKGTINRETKIITMFLMYNGEVSRIEGTLADDGTVNLPWFVGNEVAGSLGGVGCQLQPFEETVSN